jgi:hypothetical protein
LHRDALHRNQARFDERAACGSSPGGPAVLAREVRRLSVAIWAQELEVLDPVVVAVAIDVMKRHRQWRAQPLGDATGPLLLEARGEQATFEVVPVHAAARDEIHLDRRRLGTRRNCASRDRVPERLTREPESLLTCADRVALVVVPLDLGPVVASVEAVVDVPGQAALVIADRRLRDTELARDFHGGAPLSQQAQDSLACGHLRSHWLISVLPWGVV